MSKRKRKILAATYLTALLTALALLAMVSYSHLQIYRRQAGYDAARAFRQTVDAVDTLSASLEKSLYATDGGMCGKICAEICADARAAETALAALPFSTLEHEQVKAFLGQCGDYAFTLCREAAAQGFTDGQRKTMAALSDKAGELAETLYAMRDELSAGELTMDSREKRLVNMERQGTLLSTAMGEAAGSFSAEPLRYDGVYSEQDKPFNEPADETKTRAVAAAFFGVAPEELELVGYYADGSCNSYLSGTQTACVTAKGLIRLTDSRLVDAPTLTVFEGKERAGEWLETLGYEGLALCSSEQRGPLLLCRYAPVTDGVRALDRSLYLTVALDDGSLYALNAVELERRETSYDWPITEADARAAVPEGLTLWQLGKVSVESPGGRGTPCYELVCFNRQGETVTVYVNAETGRQQEILVG